MAQPSVPVVDDDAGMAGTLGDILFVSGYDVTHTSSGQAAIAMVGRSPCDVVAILSRPLDVGRMLAFIDRTVRIRHHP
jgi:DNA-binding response OmpR family regulator